MTSYNKINIIISETINKHLNYILTESQESKSIDAAKKLYMQRTCSSREEADEFVRIKLRHDLTKLRDKGAKFILGATRMYLDGQLTDAQTLSNLNTTLAYVSSDAHINEYDRNLNGMSAQDLIQRFAKAVSDDMEKDKSEIDAMSFDGESQYDIVRIDSFEQSQEYGNYTSWCVTHDEDMFDSYTNDGIGQFYFCLREGFENEEEVEGKGCPLDSYGLSMIAVSVDENGRLNTCTCRWNHDNGGDDSIMNTKELSEVINMNFYQVFKPNTKWVDKLEEVKRRLANGESLEDVFDDYYDFSEGFAAVELNGKWNFINQKREFLWNSLTWFDDCCEFYNGFAIVNLNGKCNFIDTDGEFLWKDDWFDTCSDFEGGFARVRYKGKWNFINQDCEFQLKQEFDYIDDFINGLARVTKENRQNFIKNVNGELLLPNLWFDEAYKFYDGYAQVKYNGKWNFINQEGEFQLEQGFDTKINCGFDELSRLVSDGKYNLLIHHKLVFPNQWFDEIGEFSRDGFARVRYGDKWNILTKKGKFLLKQWVDKVRPFKVGIAAIENNGKCNFVNQEGELLSPNLWFDKMLFNFGYFDEYAALVEINKQDYKFYRDGRLVKLTSNSDYPQ